MSERQLKLITSLRQCGREFLGSAIPIVSSQAETVHVDLHDPLVDEVVGGLFARVFRFLQTMVLDYHLLSQDLGQAVLRMMLESLIYLKFLITQKNLDVFAEFKKYGIGQDKLYKLQLKRLLDEGRLRDSADLREYIDSPSDDAPADPVERLLALIHDELTRPTQRRLTQVQPDVVAGCLDPLDLVCAQKNRLSASAYDEACCAPPPSSEL